MYFRAMLSTDDVLRIYAEVSPQLRGNFKNVFSTLPEPEYEALAQALGIEEADYKFLLTFLSNNWDVLGSRSAVEIQTDLQDVLRAYLKQNDIRSLKNLTLRTLNTYKGVRREVPTGGGLQVVKITDISTCVRLTEGSGWCVKNEPHAQHYLSQGPLYLVINNGKRVALLHFETKSFMDPQDNALDTKTVEWLRKSSPEINELFSNVLTIYSTAEDVYKYLETHKEIDGDLILRGMAITELPPGLRVQGHLDISGTQITALPSKLYVGGKITAANSSLKTIPPDIDVHVLDLRGTNITELPDGLHVRYDLYIEHLAIQQLPERLVVGRDLRARMTLLKPVWSIPDDLVVGRNLDLAGTRVNAMNFKKPAGVKYVSF